MPKALFLHYILLPLLFILFGLSKTYGKDVDVEKSLVWGPGLKADFLVPVRYIYVQLVDKKGKNLTDSVGPNALEVSVGPDSGERARIWTKTIDRHDGSYIVRWKLYSVVTDLQIVVKFKGKHVASSPYIVPGDLYDESCDCPIRTSDQWAEAVGCPTNFSQIESDLKPFNMIDMKKAAKDAVNKFSRHGQHSICHYKVIANQVYRKCYGEHVGFNMFSDGILLSLTRKMQLPDLELLVNLGDWPLEYHDKNRPPLPVFSWCGSTDTLDIVLPTYDITEATLEMMGRVSLDMFSVQGETGPRWGKKQTKAFWRGRDSCRARLKLVQMARNHPELLDARLTHMFFFDKDVEKYGELVKSVSFFDFFKYKYQINIDGTVAAYRFPYLLAGDSLVLKQESKYYEHFYSSLEPMVHYVPFKRDLSDLLEKLEWAKKNDKEAKKIAKNGQKWARDNLDPAHVLCYHVRAFQEYAKRLKEKPSDVEEFDLLQQPTDNYNKCNCPRKFKKPNHKKKKKDEL